MSRKDVLLRRTNIKKSWGWVNILFRCLRRRRIPLVIIVFEANIIQVYKISKVWWGQSWSITMAFTSVMTMYFFIFLFSEDDNVLFTGVMKMTMSYFLVQWWWCQFFNILLLKNWIIFFVSSTLGDDNILLFLFISKVRLLINKSISASYHQRYRHYCTAIALVKTLETMEFLSLFSSPKKLLHPRNDIHLAQEDS